MAASETPAPRLSRVFAALLAILLIAEAGSQAFFLHWVGRPFGSVFLYNWSPYGLVRNNPSLTGNFQISPDGFREMRTYSKKKPPNTFRVLLLGGSVLYSGSGGPAVLYDKWPVPSNATISQFLAKRLQADPAFKNVNVEVINGAVNFNRIVEISSAYLADYIGWSPDIVVVYGSANNFPRPIMVGDLDNFRGEIQSYHPWRLEFERLVTERNFPSMFEDNLRRAADASAAMSLVDKTAEAVAGRALDAVNRFSPPPPDAPPPQLAPARDEERYFDLYGSYALAIADAARQYGQDVAFVWEYHLGDMGGLKPLSAEEQRIYPFVKRSQEFTQYDFRTRDRWLAFFAQHDIATVNPIDALKQHNGTVFIDYLHYTSEGNDFIAGVTYQQLHPLFLKALAKSGLGGPRPPAGPP